MTNHKSLPAKAYEGSVKIVGAGQQCQQELKLEELVVRLLDWPSSNMVHVIISPCVPHHLRWRRHHLTATSLTIQTALHLIEQGCP
jgi:hypothetical protein